MAKSARATSKKVNRQKLKSRVFGPVEAARTERLSAKLQLVAESVLPQKETKDVVMDDATAPGASKPSNSQKHDGTTESMDIDREVPKSTKKGRIEKRRSSRSKAGVVFPRYKNGKKFQGSSRKR